MSISVIIVVKNGEKFLQQALDSIYKQTLKPQQIIAVVGPSIDGTDSLLSRNPLVETIRQHDEGIANARNLGISTAKSRYIAFLDHDDLWMEEKLEKQVDTLHKFPDAEYCLCDFVFFGENVSNSDRVTAGTPSAMLAKRTVFQKTGLFDATYKIGCDADWFTRARDLKLQSVTIPEILLRKRLHNSNASVSGEQNRKEMFKIALQSIRRNRQ